MTTAREFAARAAELAMVWPEPALATVRAGTSSVAPASGKVSDVLTRYVDVENFPRTCVVLVDGLGRLNLDERIGHAPTLRSGIADGASLLAPYPSTTSASIASFGTGCAPASTGMLGYTVRDPDSGVLGNLVQWTGLPDPLTWQPRPTVFETLSASGIRVTSVGPERFRDSGMTRASLRGSTYLSAEHWYDRIDAAAGALRQPGLAYVYWGDLDKAGHHHGWQSAKWCDELEKVDAGIRRLIAAVPRGTQILVTADHGMIDVDRSHRWDAATDAMLAADVAMTAGEPRALHVHAAPGADGQAIADRWRDVLGDNALVLGRDEAVAAGLFGELDEAMLPRIGDVVVAMAGRATVVDSRTQSPASMEMIGVHGSLTEFEMMVPLLRWEG
ncbi:alkaline phosphatase family protein [Rarobacter faecitabidus]|uniref:alkaline phosphatase family protein n=1 Tax=Rarobacter faecitabidus TaxID=13243 RepID=UPI001FE48698|nr:nucleotide pyrophosphatase/phosphodiesterase family protein [Rarobacter faecitabidus]